MTKLDEIPGLMLLVLLAAAIPAAAGTRDLQREIDAIAAAGGGTLTLTAGVYRTGAVFFKPGVKLHLDRGAVIEGIDEAEGYPRRETRIEGETKIYYPALINADRCDGFAISGEGAVDGHGANTWEQFWTNLELARRAGGEFRNQDLMRPRLLYVSNSKHVDIAGVTFRNSKFWTTHFYNCEQVRIRDCTILAETTKDSRGQELKGPSTDAIDLDKCHHVVISNCVIAVNDDGVAVKGGKGAWANDYAKFPENGPSSDILIADCTFRSPTHSCLTLGSECPAAERVTMRDSRMEGVGDMLHLKMRTDTPQSYSDILVEGMSGDCENFLDIGAWTQYADFGGRAPSELLSRAKNVTLRDNAVTCVRERSGDGEGTAYTVENLDVSNNRLTMKQSVKLNKDTNDHDNH